MEISSAGVSCKLRSCSLYYRLSINLVSIIVESTSRVLTHFCNSAILDQSWSKANFGHPCHFPVYALCQPPDRLRLYGQYCSAPRTHCTWQGSDLDVPRPKEPHHDAAFAVNESMPAIAKTNVSSGAETLKICSTRSISGLLVWILFLDAYLTRTMICCRRDVQSRV